METLLGHILSEIKHNGGRIKLGYRIIMESPEYFTHEQRQYFRTRYNDNVKRDKKRIKVRDDYWSVEDKAYILEKYGHIKTSVLSEMLNRSPEAIRMKFAEIASPDQKIERDQLVRRWRKKSNFKSIFSK